MVLSLVRLNVLALDNFKLEGTPPGVLHSEYKAMRFFETSVTVCQFTQRQKAFSKNRARTRNITVLYYRELINPLALELDIYILAHICVKCEYFMNQEG